MMTGRSIPPLPHCLQDWGPRVIKGIPCHGYSVTTFDCQYPRRRCWDTINTQEPRSCRTCLEVDLRYIKLPISAHGPSIKCFPRPRPTRAHDSFPTSRACYAVQKYSQNDSNQRKSQTPISAQRPHARTKSGRKALWPGLRWMRDKHITRTALLTCQICDMHYIHDWLILGA